jgi:hypothetical protein
MIKKFLYLEWKSFVRSASFTTNLALKIFLGILAFIYLVAFFFLGLGSFYIIKEMGLEPLATVNKYLIYYLFMDLGIRLLLQKIPVMNIRPLLTLPIKRPTIVHFALGKTSISFFNFVHAVFFLPFAIILLWEGYNPIGVVLWHLSIFALIYINNFLNVILANKDNLFFIFLGTISILAAAQYYALFDITNYTLVFFDGLFQTQWAFLIPIIVLILLYKFTFDYFKSNLYLDAGLSSKHDIAETENLVWLNQFGVLGTFLKNDIKLIRRNKRSKTTVFMSVMFLFYGLFFFSGFVPAYDNPTMHMFAGIFVSGGFLITFGQFVPSWDSAYYPLMMTQNISYRNYLSSKWWLMVIATFVTTILAAFYLYFGWQIYLTIVVGAIYNIGVNSHMVLLGGAYTKTPIDLASSKGAFGDKKAFNIKTLLISIPQLLLPMLLYGLGTYFGGLILGLSLVAIVGAIGFLMRDKMFTIIERVYKTEKYATLHSYKQKNA